MKNILPTTIRFDLTLVLSHLTGSKVKLGFDRTETEILKTLGQPVTEKVDKNDYHSATEHTGYEELGLIDEKAQTLAKSLRTLAETVVEKLVDGEATAKGDKDHFAWMTTYLIDWAQDENEIPEGTKGKVLLHCRAEREGKRYSVEVTATSPGYTKKK